MKMTCALLCVILIGQVLCRAETADLVLKNGNIITLNENIAQVETLISGSRGDAYVTPDDINGETSKVEALAVRGDRIAALGSNEEIRPFIGPSTHVIDLRGKTAIPGFIDSHAHLTGVGQARLILNCRDVENWEDIVALVEETVKKTPPGEWIIGRGWHQDKWNPIPEPNVDGLPIHTSLSAVSPQNPVLLTHASGHLCFANAKAMELANITAKTEDPSGGEIVRDREGNPIGAFRETAQSLVQKAHQESLEKRTPEQIRAERLRQIELAVDECVQNGITTFHDASSTFELIDLLKELAEQGKLEVRMWVMIGESNDRLKRQLRNYKIIGAGNHHLTVRAIKRFMDGALGAHGAWLLEPYSDLPNSIGLNVTPVPSIEETAQIAIQNDFQLCTHAIGDRANREILDIYEKTFAQYPEKKGLRWRVEHAQHLHPSDIPRFAELGVIASMQACHCTSDGPWVPNRLGEKRSREGAYIWRKLIDSGAVLCNGTDSPVEPLSPIACFYSSVTRRLPDGSTFYGEQCMTRKEALRSYTIDAAYAAFEEDIKGSLTPGKLADITVLSKDILTIPDEEILSTEILYTIVGGKVVYQK